MLKVTAILVSLAFFWFIASVLYQWAIRNVLTDICRFKIFALRDELRNLAISNEVDVKSFAYRHLEQKLNAHVHFTKWLTFGNFLEALWEDPKVTEKETPEMSRFKEEASDELLRINRQATNYLLLAVSANSPGYSLLMVAFGIVASMFGKACKAVVAHKVEIAMEQNLIRPVPAFA